MVLVDTVRIFKYRSIVDTGAVDLMEDITTVIGPNAAGKSNFLRACTLFGDKTELNEDEICNFADTAALDDTRIVAVHFEKMDANTFPYFKGVTSASDTDTSLIKSQFEAEGVATDCSDKQVAPFPGDSDLVEYSDSDIVFSRYSSGKHTVSVDVPIKDVEDTSNECLITELINKQKDLLATVAGNIFDEIQEALAESEFAIDQDPSLSGTVQLDELHGQLDSFRESKSSQQITNIERILEIDSFNDLINDISGIISTFNNLDRIEDDPVSELPPFLRQITFAPAPGSVSHTQLDDLMHPYSDILVEPATRIIEGKEETPGDNIKYRTDSPDPAELEDEARVHLEDISEMFDGFWAIEKGSQLSGRISNYSDNLYSFEIDISDEEIELSSKRGSEDHIPLSQESEGNRWLLSFFGAVYSQIRGNILDQDGLIVLDDPGIHFHPDFQQRMYNILELYAENSQVLFSTHSPFLVNNRYDERVRIIRRDDKETKVMTVFNYEPREGHESIDSLAPIRIELGATVGDYPFGGVYNLLVEGETDKMYINRIDRCLQNKPDYTSLHPGIELITTSGGKEVSIIKLLSNEHQEFVVLKDDDADSVHQYEDDYLFLGDELFNDKLRHYLIEEEILEGRPRDLDQSSVEPYSAMEIDDFEGRNQVPTKTYDIEEVLYKELVFEVLTGELGFTTEAWKNRVSRRDEPLGKAIKIITTEFYQNNPEQFDEDDADILAAMIKARVANAFCDELECLVDNDSDEDFDLMFERFSTLFEAINNWFEN